MLPDRISTQPIRFFVGILAHSGHLAQCRCMSEKRKYSSLFRSISPTRQRSRTLYKSISPSNQRCGLKVGETQGIRYNLDNLNFIWLLDSPRCTISVCTYPRSLNFVMKQWRLNRHSSDSLALEIWSCSSLYMSPDLRHAWEMKFRDLAGALGLGKSWESAPVCLNFGRILGKLNVEVEVFFRWQLTLSDKPMGIYLEKLLIPSVIRYYLKFRHVNSHISASSVTNF